MWKEIERKPEKRDCMFEFKSQEVKKACLGHPRIFKIPMIVSFVSWIDGTFIFSFFVSYLTNIFEMLTRDIGHPMGTCIAAIASNLLFINEHTAMPVACLQAGA
jgi:hypothetical protein